MRVLTIAAIGIAAIFVSTAVLADRNDDKARTQFKLGVELFEDEKFEQASVAFERAYELSPNYKILWNIAQAENELGNYTAALKAYTGYLAEGGSAVSEQRVDQTRAEVKRLYSLVGTIIIKCNTKGALVLVDREEQGRTPLSGPLFVDLGKHDVVVESKGKKLLDRIVKVGGGQQVVLEVEYESETKPEPDPEPEPETKPEPAQEVEEAEPKQKRLWTWVAAGVGGAAGIAAIVTGSMTSSKASVLEDNCNGTSCTKAEEDTLNKARSLATATNVFIGIAAAGIAAGIVLFFVEPKIGAKNETVAFVPTVFENGAGMSFSGSF